MNRRREPIDASTVRLSGWKRGDPQERQITREWIVTNGLGGYASNTVGGAPTRRYHGVLVAALPSPNGRVVMVSQLEQQVQLGGEWFSIEPGMLSAFDLEGGLPRWEWSLPHGIRLEKRLAMPHQQNATAVRYRILEGEMVTLRAAPWIHMRLHEEPVDARPREIYRAVPRHHGMEIAGPDPFPDLRIRWSGRARAIPETHHRREVLYRIERDRGYDAQGRLTSPGQIQATLEEGEDLTLYFSVQSWPEIDAVDPERVFESEMRRRSDLLARADPADEVEAQLVLAADQFVVRPTSRPGDEAKLRAVGDEPRTIIAGYHWFTDWGRDTMISLEGLTLATHRHREAGSILRTFASYVHEGLIPNLFPEGEDRGRYNTADATPWMFHALARYVAATGDRATLRALLPVLREIVRHHFEGTQFGIRIDPEDGLLTQGAPDVPLTWMDAKCGDWIITPRRGKTVETNALFYNALRWMETWLREEEQIDEADDVRRTADRLHDSFNRRFWCEERGWLFDVVDGDDGNDPALRPNQILAISLDHPVLARERWEAVVGAVLQRLLTPCGLRTLSPNDPDYQATYRGDPKTRDAAYHQGSAWPWLLGPLVDAWLRVHPEDRSRAMEMLRGSLTQIVDGAVGTICELCDAEPPFTPRGCIAQAWSVAEALRALRRIRS